MKYESSIYTRYRYTVACCVFLFVVIAVLIITNIYMQQLLNKSYETELQLKKDNVYIEELCDSLKDDYLELQEQLYAQ